jgi:tRNA U55 pseudouridine synthase TruB
MKRYAVIQKDVGETPLEALSRWRASVSLSPDVPLAYAGRLDPMASGTLIILIGDECKKQSYYHGYDKEYRFEVLLGCSSDTGDILGIPTRSGATTAPDKVIARALSSLSGTHRFKYPRFSSKTVDGMPLHEWTLRGGLTEDRIPTYTATVKRVQLLDIYTLSASELHTYIHERIGRIPPVTDPRKALGADFRRGTILPAWDGLLKHSDEHFTIIRASAVVTSGTYIRTLSEECGARLGTHALAYSIERTHIGTYHRLPLGFGIWYPRLA